MAVCFSASSKSLSHEYLKDNGELSFEIGVEVAKAQRFDKLVIPKPATLPGPNDESQNSKYLRDVLIVSITRTLIALVGGLALLFFVLGGVRMLVSYGDENAITASKKMLYWSVIGFLLALFSYAIVLIIGNIRLGTANERVSIINEPVVDSITLEALETDEMNYLSLSSSNSLMIL